MILGDDMLEEGDPDDLVREGASELNHGPLAADRVAASDDTDDAQGLDSGGNDAKKAGDVGAVEVTLDLGQRRSRCEVAWEVVLCCVVGES